MAHPGQRRLETQLTQVFALMYDCTTISCKEHGNVQRTYICRHLADGTSIQWYAPPALPDDPWPDAWCEACHAHLLAEGEWNEASETAAGGADNIKVVCQHCYVRIRAGSHVHEIECDEDQPCS